MQTDFLVYLLAVDEKGRAVRMDEQTGCRTRGDARWEEWGGG